MRLLDHEPEYRLFESFEAAKEAFRAKIRDFAFSKNAMFDGNGKLKQFELYKSSLEDEEDAEAEEEEGTLTLRLYGKVLEAVTEFFGGKELQLDVKDGFYTDWMVAVDIKDNSIRVCGDDDGPFNGYDPVLATNALSMQEEKDYYLYIDDCLGQEACSAVLSIDLKKVTME